MNLFINKKDKTIWLMAAIIFAAILSLDLAKSYLMFPISEGWWETYSWLDGSFGDLYKNYHVQFPPLYIKLMSVFERWFDGRFLYTRLAMVCMHLTTIAFFVLWLSRYVEVKYAILAVGFAASLVMSNPVYLAKDYHTFVELLTVLALLFLSLQKKIFRIIGAGLCCGVILLVKQNIGLFFGFSVILYTCFDQITKVGFKTSDLLKQTILFAICYALPSYIYTDMFGDSWLQIFRGNDSKGSLLTVLFRFLIDPASVKIEVMAILMVGLYFLIFLLKKYIRADEKIIKLTENESQQFSYVVTLSVSWLLMTASFFKPNVFYAFALSWPVARIYIYKILDVKAGQKLLCLPLLTLAYCGTQTAGYNDVSMEFLIGLMFAELCYLTANFITPRMKVVLQILMLSLPLLILGRNAFGQTSYNWWGLNSAPLNRGYYATSNLPEFKGIYFDSFVSNVFNYVLSVKSKIEPSDAVLATPSIPLIYKILKVKPDINPILWFDVTSSRDIPDATGFIKKYKPKYIFNLLTPGYVFDGHYKLRGKDPALFYMDESISEQISAGNYSVDYVEFPWNPNQESQSFNSPVNIKIKHGCARVKIYCSVETNHCKEVNYWGYLTDSCDVVAKNEYFARLLIKVNKVYVDYPGFVFYGLKRQH